MTFLWLFLLVLVYQLTIVSCSLVRRPKERNRKCGISLRRRWNKIFSRNLSKYFYVILHSHMYTWGIVYQRKHLFILFLDNGTAPNRRKEWTVFGTLHCIIYKHNPVWICVFMGKYLLLVLLIQQFGTHSDVLHACTL